MLSWFGWMAAFVLSSSPALFVAIAGGSADVLAALAGFKNFLMLFSGSAAGAVRFFSAALAFLLPKPSGSAICAADDEGKLHDPSCERAS